MCDSLAATKVAGCGFDCGCTFYSTPGGLLHWIGLLAVALYCTVLILFTPHLVICCTEVCGTVSAMCGVALWLHFLYDSKSQTALKAGLNTSLVSV